MKPYKSIAVMCLLTLLFTSCFEDEGNYDYNDLVPIEIDDSTVPAAIVKPQQEYLKITPTVKQGGSDANLAYEWRLKDNLNVPDPETGEFINMIIGTSKDLDFLLDVPARQYHLLLYVSDKTNGVTESRQIALTVQTIAPQGWMVLSGDDSSCDVSIVVNPKVNANVPGVTDDEVKHNVFSENNEGHRVEGEGAFVWHGVGGGFNYLYVFTKGAHGGYRTSAADLKITGDYVSCFRSMPQEEAGFSGFGSWQANELLVNGKDLYYCSQNSPSVFIPFGVKCFGVDYEASPYIGTNQYGYVYGAFYDTKHKRFLYINYQQTVLQFNPPASGAFDMNNVGKEMVYGEMAYPANFWNCVMQDEGNPATRKLYVVDLNKSVWDQQSGHGAQIIDLGTATDMASSGHFAFGTRGYVMYHATDTKVYYNNFSGDRTSTLIYDIAADYPGYKTSRIQIFKNTDNPFDSKLLFVGIYNETTKEGKLLQFVVNETNGAIEEDPTVYAGFGRIASMNYKRK